MKRSKQKKREEKHGERGEGEGRREANGRDTVISDYFPF
jgi:hypothetical protein